MRISISVTNYDGAGLGDIARAADEAGVDTLWVADHLIQADPHASPDGAMLEAYTTLGYLAAVSERVRLGAMVSAVTFREPALLVKAVTTLDVLSHGRAWLGIGAGYQQDEAAAMGLPLPPAAERFERLEETLRIAQAMWAGDQQPIHGAHYQLTHPTCYPPPATRPHPPILIGGAGEKHTLRLVARHKLDVLAGHCEQIGRPYADVEKTVSTRLDPDAGPGAFAEQCARLAALGLDHAVVITSGPWTPAKIALLTGAMGV
jgi:alkanesulfonate monooxygenase SsuD/methylene tetrahydromethanopterin reductase-like flavin-dependent oxidoreductase (luciferase family)